MKNFFRKLIKGIGIFLMLLFVIVGIIYVKATNYSTYSIKADLSAMSTTETEPEKIAEDLLSQMTLDEKIDQLYGETPLTFYPKFLVNYFIEGRFAHAYAGQNNRLGIPPWVLSDGPRGARVMAHRIDAVTTFPVGMARGASWDVDLESRVNSVIASEMRANGVNYAATPCINVLRHPGWGRAQETYGEDPWLLGEFGVAAVKAIQQHNIMACPKHFALNSIENSRWIVDVEVDERTLREVYLPHFKKVVQEGKTASIMSAYNQVNGDFAGENRPLLTNILRDEWGFEGFVSSDWVYGLYDGIKGVKAGMDVEMPVRNAYNHSALEEGIASGGIKEADIDKMVLRTLKTRLAYALAKDSLDYNEDLILKPAHIALAKETAEKSMVLLKNEGVLPFAKTKGKTIAVIGRLADVENTGDQGSSNSTPAYVVTPYRGLKNLHRSLGNEVIRHDGSDLKSARILAQEADEVILVVGYTHEDEGEYIITQRSKMVASAKAKKLVGKKGSGGDRESLNLLPVDEQLIAELGSLNKNTVVAYVGGSAIDLSSWQDKVPAILFTWYAGMEGGNALASLLYGDVNPSGKLPFTIAQNQSDYPEFNPFTDKIKYGYYHGYTLFEKENKPVAYPFGYGMSYTTYDYANLQLTQSSISTEGTLTASIEVANIGSMAGEEVVQLYIGFKNSAVDRPIKLLRDFKKVAIATGTTSTITLKVDAKDLAWYNPATKAWEIERMAYEVYVGSSSDMNDLLKGTFSVQ